MRHQLLRVNKAFTYLLLLLVPFSFFFTVCQKETTKSSSQSAEEIASARFDKNENGWGNTSPGMVLRWNDAAFYVMNNTPQPPPVTPFWSSRYTAMVHLAMHDALNGIVPKYKTYALNTRDKDASPD